MGEFAIRAQGLGKKYTIGHVTDQRDYSTLRDVLTRQSHAAVQSLKDLLAGRPIIQGDTREEIWALKDVSFDVRPGEIVGIIGRNGAGKSTLLKILSRIADPSSGRLLLRGRVACLLEVGTGFHPELTGRENIFLNGTILGMSRADIKSRFDEIVAFAEVERFLDTPVKRYSSGMYVRLAFAVAAHLEPDIIIIDEVLAVGDAQFQRKCLGKMNEVANKKGRTVLFVSHQMGMITSLCQRAILLESGQVRFEGTAPEAVATYFSKDGNQPFSVDCTRSRVRIGDAFGSLLSARIEDCGGRPVGEVDIREPFRIKMRYALHQSAVKAPIAFFHVMNSEGQCAFTSASPASSEAEPGCYEAVCTVPGNLLNNDTYSVELSLAFVHARAHVCFHERGALSFVVVDPTEETVSGPTRNGYAGFFMGAVRPALQWKVERTE